MSGVSQRVKGNVRGDQGAQGGVQVCQGVKRGVPGFKGSLGDPKGF